MVVKDSLTGLYNRHYFFYRFNSEIQRAKRYGRTVSLLILDVDDFKMFNDKYGHLAGDGFLKSVAEIMQTHIRRSDDVPSYEVDIACRYGGEEFAIILPEASSPQGMVAAERLRGRIETTGPQTVAERVITSYSIHYTKLYDYLLPLPVVTEIEVRGAKRIQVSRILAASRIRRGKPVDEGMLSRAKESVLSLLRGKGFVDAEVSVSATCSVVTGAGTVRIKIVITSYSIHYTKLYDYLLD